MRTPQAALDRLWDAPARIVARTPLTGGYVAASVERLDVEVAGRGHAVVLKRAAPGEVAAMRALAVVRGRRRRSALAVGADWLLLPFVDGRALGEHDPIPDEIWRDLARVHAHWWRRRPRGLPLVDHAWWRRLIDGATLVAVRGAAERCGAPEYRTAEAALLRWRDDERIATALTCLPRTLTHSDPHRGNILVGADGPVLIDWGNARVAPAGVDVAVAVEQSRCSAEAYEREFARLVDEPRSRAVEQPWARLHVNVQYLAFAADHLGAARVAEMTAAAEQALGELATALGRAP